MRGKLNTVPALGPALALALALALAGCSHSSPPQSQKPRTVSASSWANTTCTSINQWLTATLQESDTLKTETTKSGAGLSEWPTFIRQYFSEVSRTSETLMKQLADAGVPKTSDGANAQREIIQAFSDYQAAISQVIASLGTSGNIAGSGLSIASQITQADKAASSSLHKAVSDLKSSTTQLGQAFAGTKSCQLLEASLKNNSSIS